ncbi:MAG: hypothetical protein GIW99_05930 [Candidatus Eremiobacteraeota bacterium]|nr:hypothetical protein [Candidatus Eremiobacteraeota bacterium]MBC5827208.1 hypothetical protein [Candidatus Eremiobacteraeota bacterium]
MSQSRPEADGRGQSSLLRFLNEQLPQVSQAFSKSPLKQLRIRDAEVAMTLVKATTAPAVLPTRQRGRQVPTDSSPRHVARMVGGEAGRPYTTINAEVVGIFHSAADVPQPGEPMDAGRVLGYVEALRLRTPVRNADQAVLIAQVVEEGQAVEFGETLFIVDRRPDGGATLDAAAVPDAGEPEAPQI